MAVALPISAASDEVHDLDDITVVERLGRVLVAITEDGSVVLDHDETWIHAERPKELRQRAIPRNLPLGAVHRQGDLRRFRSSNHRLKYSG